MNPIAKTITVSGFVLALLAAAAAFLGADGKVVSQVIACGLVLAAIGITLSFLGMPKEPIPSISSGGMKVAAVGFALASIPTAIGAFFFDKTDSELAIFFGRALRWLLLGSHCMRGQLSTAAANSSFEPFVSLSWTGRLRRPASQLKR